MKPYGEDLRERIVKGRKQGESVIELSQRYAVSKSSVERYCHLQEKTGRCSPGRMGGYRRSRLEGHDKTLRGWMQKKADLTLAELQIRCREQLGTGIGINALWHRLERLNLSYKKNAARRRTKPARHEGGPPAVAQPAAAMGHPPPGLSGRNRLEHQNDPP